MKRMLWTVEEWNSVTVGRRTCDFKLRVSKAFLRKAKKAKFEQSMVQVRMRGRYRSVFSSF
jgi:hypothetical protein